MKVEWPPVYTDTFEALQPRIHLVRVMYRFLREVIAADPQLEPLYDRLLAGYVDLLQKELAPYAYDMAAMLVALEDKYAPKGDPAA